MSFVYRTNCNDFYYTEREKKQQVTFSHIKLYLNKQNKKKKTVILFHINLTVSRSKGLLVSDYLQSWGKVTMHHEGQRSHSGLTI